MPSTEAIDFSSSEKGTSPSQRRTKPARSVEASERCRTPLRRRFSREDDGRLTRSKLAPPPVGGRGARAGGDSQSGENGLGHAQLAGRPSALATSTMFMTFVLMPLPRPSICGVRAARRGPGGVSTRGSDTQKHASRTTRGLQHAAERGARQHEVYATTTRGGVAAYAQSEAHAVPSPTQERASPQRRPLSTPASPLTRLALQSRHLVPEPREQRRGGSAAGALARGGVATQSADLGGGTPLGGMNRAPRTGRTHPRHCSARC